MALIIDLKPEEKLIIGNSTITNDRQRTRLRIEGQAPILREKDTLSPAQATTPVKKLYLTIQTMYLERSDHALQYLDVFFQDFVTIQSMAPHVDEFLNDVATQILCGRFYKGLKLVQDLMNCESDGTAPKTIAKKSNHGASRGMEAQMIGQAADQLQDLYDGWDGANEIDRKTTISYNSKLWMAFLDGVRGKNNDPRDKSNLFTNIIYLYDFIYTRSDALIKNGDKEQLKTLILINREMAKALLRH